MNIEDVKEWFIIADDDFDSAQILDEAYRKHNEEVCDRLCKKDKK